MSRVNWLLLLIFLLGLTLRIVSIYPANIIFGFDQARDFFDAKMIFVDKNIRIIGPTAGNNPNLHHGVAYLYYILPAVVAFGGNPFWVATQNSIFNAATAIVIYFLARSMFNDKKIGLIAAVTTAVSFQFIQYAGWLSNPTVTIFTVPVFFTGLWSYSQGKSWGLPLAAAFLGLTIQFELFFIYLIPTAIIIWLILRPKPPGVKLSAISALSFLFTISTMIATEIKLGFTGIKSILFAGELVGQANRGGFVQSLISLLATRWEDFYLNFWPQNKIFGLIFGIFSVSFIILETARHSNWKIKRRNLFLLVWFFSPVLMLILGSHNAPWFLIGRPAAAALTASYIIAKLKSKYLITAALGLIIFLNIKATKNTYGQAQTLLEPDQSAILSRELAAIDFTYQSANGQPFAINSVTNPLYINALWAWNYNWYGKEKYGYLPTWLGGDQIYPYNILPAASGNEKLLYLFIDQTPRIPQIHKNAATAWANSFSRVTGEQNLTGITVQKREMTKSY
jgi:4-amino-4-deoxy-L-arabinose transferase-like glycosyltransferase